MPSDTLGFSGTEIVSLCQNFLGDTSSNTQTFITQWLPLAEMRFCKTHDWKFLYKVNLSLAVTNGTDQYTLDSNSIGYYMDADHVENIYDDTNKIYLAKKTLVYLRRLNPGHDSGTSTDKPRAWAPIGDNKIIIYPTNFANATLKVDGKITPNALSNLSNYPTIPYRYQESFIKYVLSVLLWRGNDSRFETTKKEVLESIAQDIRNDVETIGDTDEPRFKSLNEARNDGTSQNLELLYNSLIWNSVT